ncbi:hypothetical protein BASA62_003604 [Batrachochytrium salamandrivorans]|nr:hypothetical protein BASA62_003604 [Batrachochytrium salamandrivorans]
MHPTPLGDSLTLQRQPLVSGCIDWSVQNQAAIVIADTVYIVTPARPGLQHLSQTTLSIEDLVRGDPSCTNYASAADSYPDSEAEESHGVELKLQYALPESFRCAVWSPLGLSSTFTCLLLVVTTYKRVSIARSISDPTIGEWVWAADLFPDIVSLYKENCIADMDACSQTTCASWSEVAGPRGVSLIALGSHGGAVSIWRFSGLDDINIATWFQTKKGRVLALDLSKWVETTPDHSDLYLAAATADGSVTLQLLRMSHQDDTVHIISSQYILDPSPGLIFCCKFSPIAYQGVLCRIAVGRGRKLYICSPGVLSVSLVLPTWETISSIVWTSDRDIVRVYTTDGKCFEVALTQVSATSELKLSIRNDLSRALLIRSAEYAQRGTDETEQTFSQTTGGGNPSFDEDDNDDASQISDEFNYSDISDRLRLQVYGAAHSIYGYADFVLIICDVRVAQLYKTDAKNFCNVILWHPTQAPDDIAPLEISSQFIFSLVDPITFKLATLEYRAWGVLQKSISPGNELLSSTTSSHFFTLIQALESLSVADEEVSIQGLQSLFDDPCINALRCIVNLLSTTSHLWTASVDTEAIHHSLEAKIYTLCGYYMHALALSVETLSEELSDQDGKLIKYISQVADIYTRSRRADTRTVLPMSALEKLMACNAIDTEIIKEEFDSNDDTCPACQDPIPIDFTSVSVACRKGHMWERCAVTFQLIGTPDTLTCMGCKRGQLHLDPQKGPLHALIGSIGLCVYCGDRFRGPALVLI